MHAVSVGEVVSAVPLLRRMRGADPSLALFVSVGTLAGRHLADQRLASLADGVFYAPFDYVWIVRRVLRRLRPGLVIVLETEIWPNLWREAKRSGASLLVVNGRLSDRAYPRYRRLSWFFAPLLSLPDEILAQSAVARDRYIELGAPAGRVRHAGNLKYDFAAGETPPPAPVVDLLRRLPEKPRVWIAASTMPPAHPGDVDEDDVVIEAFGRLRERHPNLVLLLAPRRPERFEIVAAKLSAAGSPFVRRSRLSTADSLPGHGVLLVDSIGELSSLFPLADVVFMGGTLCDRGGHNILEPSFFGKPVVSGPNLQNFSEIAEEFRAGGALACISAPDQLAGEVSRLLDDQPERLRLGSAAERLARARAGASAAAADTARRLHDLAVPRLVHTTAGRLLLTPLSWLWRAGAAGKRSWSRPRRLPACVISIGGVGMGGAGKTPFAVFLAGVLRRRGVSCAFLTRGYRRRSRERVTVLEAGAAAPSALTGDEAQILIRSGHGPVGISSDRFAAGRQLLSRFPVPVLLLDDGFQHARLARDADIVLIDTLCPFGGGDVFPLGTLREPLDSLARASAFVLTRTQPARQYEGIIRVLRRYNRTAPVFRLRSYPDGWVSVATSEPSPLSSFAGVRAGAFCGLGNPASFWLSLRLAGYRPALQLEFPDHHVYSTGDLRRIHEQARRHQVEVLFTTEKDTMNLPSPLPPMPALYWLRLSHEIVPPEPFQAWLLGLPGSLV